MKAVNKRAATICSKVVCVRRLTCTTKNTVLVAKNGMRSDCGDVKDGGVKMKRYDEKNGD